ncbi:MAG: hypothetical protein GXO91_08255 [FCB group bacterium]|nr:hypothetical protein [FCB group bacterium]
MMETGEGYYILGIDGGATNSTGILIDDTGKTLARDQADGMSLSLHREESPDRVLNMVHSLCRQAGISPYDLDAIGLGLAGSSDTIGRDLVFRRIEKENLTRSTLITSDCEAAYEVTCPMVPGFLVSVGTGVICMARTPDGKIHRTAGAGHHQGDKGSGYWMGRKLLVSIALGETHVYSYTDFVALKQAVLENIGETDISLALEKYASADDPVPKVAGLAKSICKLAETGNEMALALLQEATQEVAEYIIELVQKVEYKEKNIVLGGNGSLCRNELFRKTLNDALSFDFKKINWLFSKISPAYGAAILTARLIDVEIPLEKIVGQI